MKTFIVNLFGGPCAGKSTIAAGIFYELKCLGIDSELVTEVSKDEIWNGSAELLNNQPYIFGNQLHRIWRLNNKVNVIVCDSPILLSIVYSKENSENFNNHIIESHNKFNNLNFLIKRGTHKFTGMGRVHNEQESIQKDEEIKNLLDKNNIKHLIVEGIDSHDIVRKIVQEVRCCLLYNE